MVGTGTREPKEAAVRPVGVEVGQFGSVRGSNPCRRHVRMPQAMVDDGLRVIYLGINDTPRGELISHGKRSEPQWLTSTLHAVEGCELYDVVTAIRGDRADVTDELRVPNGT